MRRQNGRARTRATVHRDRIMLSLSLRGSEIRITAVMVSVGQGRQMHQQLQAHTPERMTLTNTPGGFSATLAIWT